jgi:cytosine/adenosine deaminase-related metal-dependent hydrolase
MLVLRAAWVLPISQPPIRDGWVAVAGDRVVAVGSGTPWLRGPTGLNMQDLGAVAVLPGLVNAHTHVELSYLRGEIQPVADFLAWVRQVLAARAMRGARSLDVQGAMAPAIDEAVRCGTAVVGDISNTMATLAPLASSPLAATIFYELIGFAPENPDALVADACRQLDSVQNEHVQITLAAHAPYSVAPGLFQAIRRAVDGRNTGLSVHLAESREEVEFMRTGAGPWRTVLEELGAWSPDWRAPGLSPVQYLDSLGVLDARTLAVHGVQASDEDLRCLARRGVTLVACPRSNEWTGAGAPPIERFYASGVRVAVGTDSLASAPDLNVFSELQAMRRLAPAVPAGAFLESATRAGAEALGAAEYGTIETGKRARLIAVDIPVSVTDVEEYLVSGIQPRDIHWVDEMSVVLE